MPKNQFTSEYQPGREIRKPGRKKGRSATDWLRHYAKTQITFHNPFTNKTDRASVASVVAMQLILKATQDSDLASIKEILDRLDGKVLQPLGHSGEIKGGHQPIIIEIPPECQEDYNKRMLNLTRLPRLEQKEPSGSQEVGKG